jgi:hypothetical protein
MVEIASDRPLFKTILVEMAYSVNHLHNRVNKSRIAVLLLCLEELELGKHLDASPDVTTGSSWLSSSSSLSTGSGYGWNCSMIAFVMSSSMGTLATISSSG